MASGAGEASVAAANKSTHCRMRSQSKRGYAASAAVAKPSGVRPHGSCDSQPGQGPLRSPTPSTFVSRAVALLHREPCKQSSKLTRTHFCKSSCKGARCHNQE